MNVTNMVVLQLLALVGLFAQVDVGQGPKTSIPDVEWDQAFTRSSGWTGGDVAGTVDLLDGRTLWVFGDSWFGEVEVGKHVAGSKMVNNSIAVHPQQKDRTAPKRESILFLRGNDTDGEPQAWASPGSPENLGGELAAHDEKPTWFWANGGGVVVPNRERQGRRLFVFLFHMGRRSGGEGVWNFKNVGGAVAIVDNAESDATQWRPRVVRIPHCVGVDAAKANQELAETSWGVAAVRNPKQIGDEQSYVYIYGVRVTGPLNKQLILARVPDTAVEQFDQWTFFAGDDEWSDKLQDCVSVADNATSELSVSRYFDERGKPTMIMVHSEPFLGTRIMVRTAPRLQGPWTPPKAVHHVTDVARDKDYFTYAARGHVHLSRKNELLVTYIVNSHNFGKMVNDASIYRPRFVRIPIGSIIEPE